MFWPGQSPDLKPIVNIWADTGRHFSSVHELFEASSFKKEGLAFFYPRFV